MPLVEIHKACREIRAHSKGGRMSTTEMDISYYSKLSPIRKEAIRKAIELGELILVVRDDDDKNGYVLPHGAKLRFATSFRRRARK